MLRTAILTVSDRGAGEGRDDAVSVIREILSGGPFVEVDYQHVSQEQAIIRSKLRLWADGDFVDLVLTTGGTGLALRDRTPEATLEVIERPIPGLAELMRLMAIRKDRSAALSRAVAGVRSQTLIVNLPGGVDAVRETLTAVVEILPEAVDSILGEKRSAPGDLTS